MTENEKYSVDNTYRFLRIYAKLESNFHHYDYLDHKYPDEMKLFRHLRNDLSHNTDDQMNYPFIVSEAVLNKIEEYFLEVSAQAYAYAVKVNKIPRVTFQTPLAKVFETMIASDYPYLPILDEKDKVRGIITTDAILKIIIKSAEDHFQLENMGTVDRYMPYFALDASQTEVFKFLDKKALFYESLELFRSATADGKVLGAVFITENGHENESLLAMMTSNEALSYRQ